MNSKPHIGHAFEFILGDAISKFLKHKNYNVHFNVGLDEHGLKVYQKAKELNIDISDYINQLTNDWLDFCQKFDIKFDTFYKTSSQDHHTKVKQIWNNFLDRGDIYKKEYNGKYCVGCESYKTIADLTNNICSDHPTLEIKDISEENYFFRLSKYKEFLLNWVDNNNDFLVPKYKINELKNLIINSDDISISRIKENCPWGIDVPNDSEHVIYVWFEALWNYALSAGYLTDNFNWETVIQLCGPDNLRFQGLILQALLKSEGIKNSTKLLVHGTILDSEGRKISKSIGNIIDPIEQLDKYGIDAVRYYALSGLSTYNNSNWSENDLVKSFNSDICNDWGNLISRTLHLIDTKNVDYCEPRDDFKKYVDSKYEEVVALWYDFKIKDALFETNNLVKYANRYINEKTPWSTNDTQSLNDLIYLIKCVNELYYPVFSDKYDDILSSINLKKKVVLFTKI